MDNDGDSKGREFEELVEKLLAHLVGDELRNTLNASGFRIMIACGEVPLDHISHRGTSLKSREEPYIEIHTIGDKLKIVAELPGITTQDLDLEVQDNMLHISTRRSTRQICKHVDLPPIDADTLSYTLSHGVLEVTFNKKDEMRSFT